MSLVYEIVTGINNIFYSQGLITYLNNFFIYFYLCSWAISYPTYLIVRYYKSPKSQRKIRDIAKILFVLLGISPVIYLLTFLEYIGRTPTSLFDIFSIYLINISIMLLSVYGIAWIITNITIFFIYKNRNILYANPKVFIPILIYFSLTYLPGGEHYRNIKYCVGLNLCLPTHLANSIDAGSYLNDLRLDYKPTWKNLESYLAGEHRSINDTLKDTVISYIKDKREKKELEW